MLPFEHDHSRPVRSGLLNGLAIFGLIVCVGGGMLWLYCEIIQALPGTSFLNN